MTSNSSPGFLHSIFVVFGQFLKKTNIVNKKYFIYFPIQIVKLKCKALSIKGFRGCVFIWATTGQQNPLKQVQVQHKEKKKCCLV